MASTGCGFSDTASSSGSELLNLSGPTIPVDIGFDPTYVNGTTNKIPVAGIKALPALVDTGAGISCIDNLMATQLGLPIVDRKPISGSNGKHTTNIYQAQIYVPSLKSIMWGMFAGVELISGGAPQQAILGRDFLRNYKMVYEGTTGAVEISN